MGQTHEDQCKICNVLNPEDIAELEKKAINRRLSYENIGKEYGIKYNITVSKQQVSNHMKWLREQKLDVERDELLEEHKEKVLDALDEHRKIHEFAWEQIEELQEQKAGSMTTDQLLRINNTQDRYLGSLLKGLRLLTDLTGATDRDTRKIDITVALKDLRDELSIEEDE